MAHSRPSIDSLTSPSPRQQIAEVSDVHPVNSQTDELVSRTLFHSCHSFDRSEKLSTFIYFNFGVLLQDN